jgi:DNA-binding LacI/PurR family transcriptional regulator
LRASGAEQKNDWLIHGDFREESGRRAMDAFLQFDALPTAVCIANNFMAYGAIKSIYRAGLRIPEDISIGAFDIVDSTGLMQLSITSIFEPSEEIGTIASDMCLQAIAKRPVKFGNKIVLEHQFFANKTVRGIVAQQK